MHRIDHSTNNATLPSPDAAGTAGYFKKGDPGTGVPATVVTADWANAQQEELAYVIEQAGLTLSKTNNTQLRQAIQNMIAAANSAIVISNATFEASVANGEAVRWDAGNSRFDEAIADGSANGNAVGIADVTNSKVYCYGETPALFSGLTPGSKYYLSDATAGAVTATAPAGHKVILGVAKSATVMFVDIDQEPISTRQYVDVRQTTLNGRIDAATGLPNFLEGSGTALEVHIRATAQEPLIVTFAAGSDAQGSIDYVSPTVAADVLAAWTVPANALSLLYIDRNVSDGTITRGSELGIHGLGPQEGYIKTPIDSTPLMTSNSAPYGAASASSEVAGTYLAWKAFDGTNPPTDADSGWVATGITGWLRYQFPAAQVAKRYTVTNRNAGALTRAPKAWTFEGSNNGTTWDVLDTRTNQTDWAGGTVITKSFDLANTTAYLYYRINITESNDATYVGLGEMEILCVQSFFSIPEMKMYEWGGGTTWTQKHRRFVGEAISGASSITSAIAYALRDMYQTAWTTPLPGTSTQVSKSHNLGVTPRAVRLLLRNIIAEAGYLPGDEVEDVYTSDSTPLSLTIVRTRNTCGFCPSSSSAIWATNKTTGVNSVLTLANWAYSLFIERGW